MACLVLGTESSSIYILDPEAFTIMDSLELPSPPVFLSVTGLYDVEFRILVTCRLPSNQSIGTINLCRDGALCLLKRGWPSAKLLCQLDHFNQPRLATILGSSNVRFPILPWWKPFCQSGAIAVS